MAHPSSKAPAAYMPPEARIDLALRPGSFRPSVHQTFTVAHLQSMQCGGTGIFKEPISYDFFYNALRMSWKVTGRALRTYVEHQASLFNFLSMEWQGKFIIMELFTDAAECYLLQQEGPAFNILATVIKDLYETQWVRWTELNTRERLTHDQLVIQHAQNTSNQLSNFVLAFTNNKADSALQAWAQHTAAQHLVQIISQGHLPPGQGTDGDAMLENKPSAITLNPVAPAPEFMIPDGDHHTSNSPLDTATAAGTSQATRMAPNLSNLSPRNKRKASEPITSPYFPRHPSKKHKGPAAAKDNTKADGSNSVNQTPIAGPSRVFGGRANPYGPLTAGRDVYITYENNRPYQANNQSIPQNSPQNNNFTGSKIPDTEPSSLNTDEGHGNTGARTRGSEDGEVME